MKKHAADDEAAMMRTDWVSVAIVFLAGVVAALQVGKVVIALPALRTDLGLDLTAAGWVMAVFALLGVVGGIPAGAMVNRFGDRRLLILGLVALALGSAAGALASNLAVLLGARIIEGAGFLLIMVAAPAVLQRIAAPRDRDLTFAIWATFFPTGMAIALLVGSVLEGWRGFWLANAALAGLVAVMLVVTVRRGEPNVADLSWRVMGRDAGMTIRAGGPLLLAGAFAVYTFQYFAVFSFLPILLVERMEVSVAVAGVLSAVAVVANILGNLVAGVLLGRGVARWALIAVASAVMGLAGIGIFVPATPALLVFLLCVIFSGVGGILPATVLGSAPELAPTPRLAPISVGLVIQGNNLGQLIGPVAVGAIVDAAGWSAAAIPAAAAGALGVILAFALRRSLRSRARRAGGPGNVSATVGETSS